MASYQRPPRPPRPSNPPEPDQSRPGRQRGIDFDPHRLKLPQAAIVGFAIGVFFHACVVFAVLDDGSAGGSSTAPREEVTLPQATVTPTPLADRTDCNAIRQTDYRSESERQWFLRNCVGG